MPQYLQRFILPTSDVFRQHTAWVAACAAVDIQRLDIAERCIDPFLRALRTHGLATFQSITNTEHGDTAFLEDILQSTKRFYAPMPAHLHDEFWLVWKDMVKVFVCHGLPIYQACGQAQPRLAVVSMEGGDAVIAQLPAPVLDIYI